MIKGRYVALVEIDMHIEEQDGVRPFEELRDDFVNGSLTNGLKEMLDEELGEPDATVTVTQQYANLYRIEGEADG